MKPEGYLDNGKYIKHIKINDEVVEVWSSILKKVKNSQLLLKTSVVTSQELYEKKFK